MTYDEQRLAKELEFAEQRICDFQAASMLDVGNQGGPCLVEPRHIEAEILRLRALASDQHAMLESVRWDGSDSIGTSGCLICHQNRDEGCLADCELDALLRRGKEQT